LHLFVSQKSLNDEERGGNCILMLQRSYGPGVRFWGLTRAAVSDQKWWPRSTC